MTCQQCGHPYDICLCRRSGSWDREQLLLALQDEYAFLMVRLMDCIRRWNLAEATYAIDSIPRRLI